MKDTSALAMATAVVPCTPGGITSAVHSRMVRLPPHCSATGPFDINVTAASGRAYEVQYASAGDLVYSDRAAVFSSLGSFTPANGFVYIRTAADDRRTFSETVQFELTVPSDYAVFLIYSANDSAHSATRPWIATEGWAEVAGWALPAVAGGVVEPAEVRAKTFSGGGVPIQVRGHNSPIGSPLVFVREGVCSRVVCVHRGGAGAARSDAGWAAQRPP